MHQKRRFSNRFSETVMTNAVLTENDGKLTMHQNVRDSFARNTCPFHGMILPIFLVRFAHFLVRFAHFLSKICFGSRFRVTGISYPVLTENEEKRILHPKRCFRNSFSETVMTSAVLTENEGGAVS